MTTLPASREALKIIKFHVEVTIGNGSEKQASKEYANTYAGGHVRTLRKEEWKSLVVNNTKEQFPASQLGFLVLKNQGQIACLKS
jgi:hypothetical protein